MAMLRSGSNMTTTNPSIVPSTRKAKPRRSLTELTLYALGFIALVCIATAGWQEYSVGGDNARTVADTLQLAGLSELPEDAKEVKAYKDTTGSQTAYYLVATLSDQQIKQLLAHSPVLAHATVNQFTIDHNYLSEPSFDVDIDSHRHDPPPHLYFAVPIAVQRQAPWYDPTITRSGERYLYVDNGHTCEVDANNYEGKLYIKVIE